MEKNSKKWFYLAIFLTSCGVFVSQIVLSNIFYFVLQNDFRFFSASLALLGLGAGGIFASVFFKKIKANFPKSLSLAGFSYMATIVLPYLFLREIPLYGHNTVYIIILACLAGFLNFFFGGLIISLIFAGTNNSIFKLSFFDLIGAAIGGMGIYFLTDSLGIFSAIYFLFAIGVGVFLSCWVSNYGFKFNKKTIVILVFLAAAILIIAKTSFDIKCSSQFPGFVKEQSNSFSRLCLYEFKKTKDYYQFNISLDILYTTGFITKNIENVRKPLDDFRNIIFKIANYKKVLVVGSGAGQDVSRALLAGSEEITAVEMNKLMIDLTNSFPQDLGKSPYQDKRVKTVISEARTYMSQNKEKYDLLLLAHARGFGNPLGTQLLVPQKLYTLEALSEDIDRLEPNGTLAIAHFMGTTAAYSRALSLLAAQRGLSPEKHLVFLASPRENSEMIIFKKNGFSSEEKEKIRSLAIQDNLAYYDNVIKNLESWPDYYKIRIITDDMPYQMGSYSPNATLYLNSIPLTGSAKHFIAIVLLFIASLTITILAFLLKSKNKIKNLGIPMFFVGICFGLAGLEFVFMNKLTLLLGNPTYSHIVALSSMLLFCGLGSLFAANKLAQKNIRKLIIAIVLVILISYFSIENIVRALLPLSYLLKILSIIGFIFIPSFLSGIFFPIALKKIREENNAFMPWFWGIDALAFVTASLIISLIAIFYGVKIILIVSVLGYLLALATMNNFEELN